MTSQAMTPADAIRALNALNEDPETGHSQADDILLATVPAEVADAWIRAAKRCGGFWYS